MEYVTIPFKEMWSDPLWLEPRVYSEFEAWTDLILLAASDPQEHRGVSIARGQVLTSERYLCSKWQWTGTQLARFLGTLERDGRVRTVEGVFEWLRGVLLLDVVEYDEWATGSSDTGVWAPDLGPMPTRPDRRIPAIVRQRILARGSCAACGATESLQVDHIVPVSRGGSNSETNLQPLCAACNVSKGAKMPDEWNHGG